jgi:hypothetical protein
VTATAASIVFDFVERCPEVELDRQEVVSDNFWQLRRALRSIVFQLHEVEAEELAEQVRALLSEWLTAPAPLLSSAASIRAVLGPVDVVRIRFGEELAASYEAALTAAGDLRSAESPLRLKVAETLRRVRASAQSFKVFCHKNARQHFQSLAELADGALNDGIFLHSLRDYREAYPFDVLVKVGPLRSGGWGWAPDALVSAPRFRRLIQIVWDGSQDEPGFGYDPVIVASSSTNPSKSGSSSVIVWTSNVTRTGESALPGFDSPQREPSTQDDLSAFRQIDRRRDRRPATLIEVDDALGLLYTNHAKILSFDPNPLSKEPISQRAIGDTLSESMFLIVPKDVDFDLGEIRAGHGSVSRVWKDKLARRWQEDQGGMILDLMDLGVADLSAAIERWCQAPTTVIHAPRSIKDFGILLKAIDLDQEMCGIDGGEGKLPFWRVAWNEIRHSRGQAIQAGFQETEIVDAELRVSLKALLPVIRNQAGMQTHFDLDIPASTGIKGVLGFYAIRGIEPGFNAPDDDLKLLLPLHRINQWRV